jgi:hypothetical protein
MMLRARRQKKMNEIKMNDDVMGAELTTKESL